MDFHQFKMINLVQNFLHQSLTSIQVPLLCEKLLSRVIQNHKVWSTANYLASTMRSRSRGKRFYINFIKQGVGIAKPLLKVLVLVCNGMHVVLLPRNISRHFRPPIVVISPIAPHAAAIAWLLDALQCPLVAWVVSVLVKIALTRLLQHAKSMM